MIDTLPRSSDVNASGQTAYSSAGRAAMRNWIANSRALTQTQPTLVDAFGSLCSPMEWVYGRDGALTGIDGNRWWQGCSLPRRTAEYMLAKAEITGNVICFLLPTTAAQLRVTLSRMQSGQTLVALAPDETVLRMILACEDFSEEIGDHRLFFAWGDRWEDQLDRIFQENPGLPLPNQFVRPILADPSAADALVAPAQKIFAECSTGRLRRMVEIRQAWVGGCAAGRICLVAPSQFRLWDDSGAALWGAMCDAGAESDIVRFDSDDPASSSPLALAEAAARCDAIVTPNSARANLPEIIPHDMPWAAWITAPRIPSAAAAGPKDTLILADPAWKPLAVKAGWTAHRLFIGQWPESPAALQKPQFPGVFEIPAGPYLALLCDTRKLDPPPRVQEYSSQRILWESIAHELTANPFALRPSIESYLANRMSKEKISDEGLDRALFLDGLIAHAYLQGLARLLLKERIPVRLFGVGWENIAEFRPYSAGPLHARDQFHQAASQASALVHVWPTSPLHPIDTLGKPVLREHIRREAFLRDARLALAGKLAKPREVNSPLTLEIVRAAIGN